MSDSLFQIIRQEALNLQRASPRDSVESLAALLQHSLAEQGIDDPETIRRAAEEAFEVPALSPGVLNGRALVDSFDHRTGVLLPGGSHEIGAAAARIFAAFAARQSLFLRGDRIAEIDHRGRRIEPMTPESLCSRIEELGPCVVQKSQGARALLQEDRPTPTTAKALLAARAARELLPRLDLLSEFPVAVEVEGRFEIVNRGYHAPTGTYVFHETGVPEVPRARAVEDLLALYREFRFVSEGDRARTIAALIQPAMQAGRWLFGRTPMTVYECDDSQGGKTLQAQMVPACYGDRATLIARQSGGVGSVDESIASSILHGFRFPVLDNLRGKIDSPFLEGLMTAEGPMLMRAPYQKPANIDPRHVTLSATTNGTTRTRDAANRENVVRILKREGFAFTFNPLAEIKSRPEHYLGCIYAVVRAWHAAGKPLSTSDAARSHNLAQWAGVMEWICREVFALPGSPLDDYQAIRAAVSNEENTLLKQVAIAARDARLVGMPLRVNELVTLCRARGIHWTDPRARSNEATSDVAHLGRRLKSAMQKSDLVDVGGITVTRGSVHIPAQGKRASTYTFAAEGVEADAEKSALKVEDEEGAF